MTKAATLKRTCLFTIDSLNTVSTMPEAISALSALNTMLYRPDDRALAAATNITLNRLRSRLISEASPDYWIDPYLNSEGELKSEAIDLVGDIVAERRLQIDAIDEVLSSL
jgi:hypothetical protein